jgi:hypothetical protein
LLALLALLLVLAARLVTSPRGRVWLAVSVPAVLVPALVVGPASGVIAPLRTRPATPAAATPAVPLPLAPAGCRFAPDFAAFRALVPAAGECLGGASLDPYTGDLEQRTTTGLMVWRLLDNLIVFTDGQGTWLNGPNGLAFRPNTLRFPWEANPTGLPTALEGHPSLAAPGALLPAQRIVTYYGHPQTPAMGILGQRTPQQMMAALVQQAQQYTAADPATPVRTALHLVTPVALASPGPDGMYRGRTAPEDIERVAQWAESGGHLLILDIQPGRSPWAAEVEALLPYLARPYVHLALDPEWAMSGNQIPGQVFGTMDAAAVNQTIQTLAKLVSEKDLPPKLLIIHRFRDDMLTNYRQIRPDPRVQVVVAMDGVGGQAVKAEVYGLVVRNQPVQYAGLKIFYTQDVIPFSPRQALALNPIPHVVIYQ